MSEQKTVEYFRPRSDMEARALLMIHNYRERNEDSRGLTCLAILSQIRKDWSLAWTAEDIVGRLAAYNTKVDMNGAVGELNRMVRQGLLRKRTDDNKSRLYELNL